MIVNDEVSVKGDAKFRPRRQFRGRGVGAAGRGADQRRLLTFTEMKVEAVERELRIVFEDRRQLSGYGVGGDLPRELDQDPRFGVPRDDIQRHEAGCPFETGFR